MSGILCRTIEEAANGMTLQAYLRQYLYFTKAQIRSVKFRDKGLMVNGKRERVTCILKGGDVLEILLADADAASGHLEEDDGMADILYEDEDLLAVWKEAGLAIHPSPGHYSDTLSNRVHAYFRKKGENVKIRSIGRLDKDTSGIVVFAKNQIAAARLWKQKEDGRFWKEYLAVAEGEADTLVKKNPTVAEEDANKFLKEKPEGYGKGHADGQEDWVTVDCPIAPMPGEKMKMCVSPDGKRAVTHYHVVNEEERRKLMYESDWKQLVCEAEQKRSGYEAVPYRSHQIETLTGMCSRGNRSLLRVRIETGRTHQIRVHMASIGHPLAGDVLYGYGSRIADRTTGREAKADELCLCAWKAQLFQPFTGEKIVLQPFCFLLLQPGDCFRMGFWQ